MLCAWIVAMHDASPSLSAAQDFSASQIGWHVFLASLVVLVFLRPPGSTAPPAHLNLRIFVLGVCIGGLALYLTSHLAASLAVSKRQVRSASKMGRSSGASVSAGGLFLRVLERGEPG